MKTIDIAPADSDGKVPSPPLISSTTVGSPKPTRRRFLGQLAQTAIGASLADSLLSVTGSAAIAMQTTAPAGQVHHRMLGKTGLMVSEIGFGGHSWSYAKVPGLGGSWRKATVAEAVEMIGAGLAMGVNFLDSCTPEEESSTPGEALKHLNARDRVIISIRVSHMMKGRKEDRDEIYKWTNRRLQLWQTDRVDLCLLCNTENDTPESGYWDMSYSVEALDKLKQQGKIRYTGFGCHFTPELFQQAIDRFGDYFDICSVPYNVRHRAAETVLKAAKKKNMGTITIKPFARGALLKGRELETADAGLPRDMISFVLENPHVDICTCGVHTLSHVKENFSASWTRLTPAGRKRLGIAAATPCPGACHAWMENDWLHA
jgi:aryl-alcohol dehydrogenase-like predicted oxidoreductase